MKKLTIGVRIDDFGKEDRITLARNRKRKDDAIRRFGMILEEKALFDVELIDNENHHYAKHSLNIISNDELQRVRELLSASEISKEAQEELKEIFTITKRNKK